METEHIKRPTNEIDKNRILSQASEAFDSMKKVLSELNPPETIYLSEQEENFYFELNCFVEKEIKNLQSIREHLKTNVEWDKLNIAFFGETNAGKSSTIESILSYFSAPTNGTSIGNGTKDFTKDVTYHNFRNNKKNIGLIDLPGIEGDEQGNLDDIDAILKKGITKAHLIFYVYGNNKKPEPATVQKIKKYLDEQAIVYSICNNRGKAGQYRRILKREGKVFLKESEVNQQSKEVLTDVLGPHYKGDLFINSLAAYLSTGNIEREDFKRDKESFLEVFKSDENLKKFSNLNSIINIIERNSQIVDSVILESNKKKLNHVLNEVVLSLGEFEKQNLSNSKIEVIKNEINEFFQNVFAEIRKSEKLCKNNIVNNIDFHFRKVEGKINELIDEGLNDENKVKYHLRITTYCLDQSIKKSIKKSKADCIKRIENHLKQLERHSSLKINNGFVNSGQVEYFELKGLSEMDISFGDLTDFGLALSGFIFGPWGGAISIAGWGISKLMGDGGKQKARNRISEELRSEKNKLKAKVKTQITQPQYKTLETNIFNRLESMRSIPDEMLEWKNKINNSRTRINQLIIE